MKNFILILFSFIFNFYFADCFGQVYQFDSTLYNNTISPGEIIIYNQTQYARTHFGSEPSYSMIVRIYPEGALFNKNREYSPIGISKIDISHRFPICGGDYEITSSDNSLGRHYLRINFDDGGTIGGIDQCQLNIGFGLYIIEFWRSAGNGLIDFTKPMLGSLKMDWRDAEFQIYSPSFQNALDIRVDYFNEEIITFKHYPAILANQNNFYDIDTVNQYIKMWELFGTGQDPIPYSKGTFKAIPEYTNFPIDGRNNYMGINPPLHLNPNNIELNFKIDSNLISNIIVITEQSLNFQNGASLIAKNVTFNTTSSGASWNGIKLENSGSDTIINCTFNNAKNSITIRDDNLGNHPNKIIRKNTFNISQTSGRGIDIRNQNKILIDSNTFNFSNSNSTIGIFFRNSEPPNSGASQNNFFYNLNIVNNKFNYGYLPIYISNLTSSRPPFYIYKNSFIGNNIYSIGGSKISGDIKNNKFDLDNINRAIGLWNSNPNIYRNDISSISANMYLNVSFPTMNPSVNANNQLVWKGGRNAFNSLLNENIYLDGSYSYIDNGRNLYFVDGTNHHLLGRMPDSVKTYRMTYNCWTGHNDLPNYCLYKLRNDTLLQISDVIYSPTYCDATINSLSNVITDRGDGIYDTVLVTNTISSDPISDDEILLNQARASNDNKDFADAITNYKGLINDFAGSEYVYTSLYEIYDNYCALDTSDIETATDALFGNLRQYLQNKISSYDYDKDFNSIAYEIILMCETQMKNYEAALTGYEFIALYHPNADQRMLASWDYEEIEGLINGEGGGEKLLQITDHELQIEEYELNEIMRLDKLINDDPLLRTLKKNYDKVNSNEKYRGSDKIADDKIILRAKENIFVTKFLQKEEKEIRFIDDLKLLMSKGNTNSKSEESKISEPQEYKLNQNYPNPFNPTTNIIFEIPIGSHVIVKVYDITGKQVRVLLNEFKQKGNYNITFDGQNLSSGVYYYKLESGSFSVIKKMLLIK